MSRRGDGSLRLSHCLYTHKVVLGKRGNMLRFNKRLRMGNYRGNVYSTYTHTS